MLSCQDVSRLISESMDHELPFRQRLSVRIHLLMCSLCSRFRRQLLFLRAATRHFVLAGESDDVLPDASLSPEARERIRRTVEANNQ